MAILPVALCNGTIIQHFRHLFRTDPVTPHLIDIFVVQREVCYYGRPLESTLLPLPSVMSYYYYWKYNSPWK